MAVLDELPGLHVSIHNATDDENSFKEHDPDPDCSMIGTSNVMCPDEGQDRVDGAPRRKRICTSRRLDTPAVSKYIEIEDANRTALRICWEFKPDTRTQTFFGGHSLAAKVYLDGMYVDGKAFKDIGVLESENGLGSKVFMTGARRKVMGAENSSSPWVKREFQFAKIMVDCDSNDSRDSASDERFQNIGCVEIEMYRVKTIRPKRRALQQPFQRLPANANQQVPEKALKGRAISHAAFFGDYQKANPVRFLEVQHVGGPFVVFKFHFRTLDNLQKLGVVARAPTPLPLEAKSFFSLTAEEIALIKEIRRRDNYQKNIEMRRF